MAKKYESGMPHEGQFVVYLRVSTAKQGHDGNGIDAQRQTCFDYLNGGGWKVEAEFIEVESGKKNDRPQLLAALELCRKEKATLLVAKLDRLARNVAFVSKLMESGVDFVAADMPMANKLTIHIIAAMAEYERDQISERTKKALAVVKARGTVLGNPRLGEAAIRGNEVKMANAALFAENTYPIIERVRSFGITSLRGIANELTERKVATPSGRSTKWHPQQVKLIIQRIEKGED
jgi:DNA invertase Pin-like site-specific DNA recombinase